MMGVAFMVEIYVAQFMRQCKVLDFLRERI